MAERITQFRVAVFRISTDKEGQSRIIFEAPLSEMPSVAKLYLALEEELLVTVERPDKP